MKIVFVGCVQSSYLFLKELINNDIEIAGVITKKESNFNSDFCDLSILCEKHGIDYIHVKHINDVDSKEYIALKKPDLILCLGWSQLLDEQVLSMASIGCIGFHPAALPNNKGRHPIIWALALGLKQTASSLFFMDEKADGGEIISQEDIVIEYKDDAASLYKKIMDVAVVQLVNIINDIKENKCRKCIPNNLDGNSWRKRGKSDGEIDWRMSSNSIYNLIRALTHPYVGAHFSHKGNEYKVWKAKEVITDLYDNIEPGKVLKVESNHRFLIKTGENAIEILDCDDVELIEGEYL